MLNINELSEMIVNTQKEISDVTAENGYYNTYKKAEFWTWRSIPHWINKIFSENKKENINILDIGCAYGTLLVFCKKFFDNAKLFGVDFKDFYLSKKIINDNGINFEKKNIELETIPWDKKKFDIIFLTEVLEHFNFNPLKTFKKIISRLNKNGIIFLSTPDPSDWQDNKKYKTYKDMPEVPKSKKNVEIIDDHVHLYAQKELEEIFKKSGLKIVEFEMAPGYHQAKHFNYMLKKV